MGVNCCVLADTCSSLSSSLNTCSSSPRNLEALGRIERTKGWTGTDLMYCDTGETMDFISIPEAATLLTGSLEDCGVKEGFEKRKFPGAGDDGSGLKVATPLLLPPRGLANIRP